MITARIEQLAHRRGRSRGHQSENESRKHCRYFLALLICGCLLSVIGCAHKRITSKATPAAVPASDMSYHDLAPGERLRIVVPVLTSDDRPIAVGPEKIEGNTITLSASNLAGYEISEYAVEKRGGGKVELRFASAAITKDGKTSWKTQAPKLPFALPEKAQYIRLLYLIRNSQADHNMAIVAARKRPALEVFTKQLKERPEICASNKEIFCTWVPAGIAVRPEAGAAAN